MKRLIAVIALMVGVSAMAQDESGSDVDIARQFLRCAGFLRMENKLLESKGASEAELKKGHNAQSMYLLSAAGLASEEFALAEAKPTIEKCIAEWRAAESSNSFDSFYKEVIQSCSALQKEHGPRAMLLALEKQKSKKGR
jgi:hypothetical protein